MDGAGAELRGAAEALRPELVRWRRHLHANPELSGQERETAAFVAAELEALGLRPRRPLPNAVVVDVGTAAPRIALRADIDALPIAEETGLPFASRRPGVMHACGHDGHTAILLGVAALLAARAGGPAVRLLFQPAEEVPPGGALDLIAAGALEGIEAIAGLHLWAPLRSGEAVLALGPAWAAADRFRATIRGRAGHGAEPHAAIDALETACRAVVDLQSIVSRRVDPLQPAVVSVGRLQAGEAFNAIAGRAVLEGTVRAFDEEVRRAIRRQVGSVLEHAAAAAGAGVEIEYVDGYPPLVNDPAVGGVLAAAAAAQLGAGAVAAGPRAMVADDFARYLERVPGAYLQLGAGGAGPGLPHHHPRFDIDEAVLPVGTAILADAALRLGS
jgi:amidohydrolase